MTMATKRPLAPLAYLAVVALAAFTAFNVLREGNEAVKSGESIESYQSGRQLRILEEEEEPYYNGDPRMVGIEVGSERYEKIMANRARWQKQNRRKNQDSRKSKRKKERTSAALDLMATAGGWAGEIETDEAAPLPEEDKVDYPTEVCQLPIDRNSPDLSFLDQFNQCPGSSKPNTILMLEGPRKSHLPGHNILAFFHALQYARDQDIQLGIPVGGWVMETLFEMFLAIDTVNWERRFEEAFCLKIVNDEATELAGWTISRSPSTSEFMYEFSSGAPLEDYMNYQKKVIRLLWGAYNTGTGFNMKGRQVSDMCSGVNALFGDAASTATYSVVHIYYSDREQIGHHFLNELSQTAGVGKKAAIYFFPRYIKDILGPLDMLKYPIIVLTNEHPDPEPLQGLLDDPDIGPQIRIVPTSSAWYGGDLTLATMANVFIGNPTSTLTTFASKSRQALGIGNSFLFRVWDKNAEVWKDSCDETCVFDSDKMGTWA